MKFILSILFLMNIAFGADKILISCSNAKTELYDLVKKTSTGYSKGPMTIDLIIKGNKVFVKSNTGESELIYLGGKNPQFLEKVPSGHYVFYTYFKKQKILTIQKSYDLFGPIMVATYLACK